MSLNEHAISTITIAALVTFCSLVLLLGFLAYRNIKRAHEGFSRAQRNQDQARALELVSRKVDEFKARKAASNATSLQVLSKLGLEEIGSDKNIRLALNRIQELQKVDPWAGKAAAVEQVDLCRFFTYVTEQKVNLADANLSEIVRKVQDLGGERPPVERFKRRGNAQLTLAGVLSLACVLLVWVHMPNAESTVNGLTKERPTPDTVVPSDTNPPLDSTGVDDDSSGMPEFPRASPVDSPATTARPDSQWIAYVRGEAARVGNLMEVMTATANSGAYSYAIRRMMDERSRLGDLQSRFPDASPSELLKVIEDLDQWIANTVPRCARDSAYAEENGEEAFVCH